MNIKEEKDMKENMIEKEECFGCISLNKTYGGGRNNRLFMSSIDNPTSVCIEISHAEKIINEFGEERVYHDGLPIISIEMSPSQFASLLLEGNRDSGVPCTIRKLNGQRVAPLSEETKNTKERIQDFYKEKMKEAAKELLSYKDRVKSLLNKNYLTKEEKEEINNVFNRINMQLTSNFPFWASMFDETMEKITVECKSEIDATFQSLINKVGVESLKKMGVVTPNNPLAIENKEEE